MMHFAESGLSDYAIGGRQPCRAVRCLNWRKQVPGPMRLITILVHAASLVVAEGIVPTLSSGQDASQSASQNPQETSAVEFSDEEVSHHRIGQPKAIHLPRIEEWSFFRSVRLNLIVDTEGNVISGH